MPPRPASPWMSPGPAPTPPVPTPPEIRPTTRWPIRRPRSTGGGTLGNTTVTPTVVGLIVVNVVVYVLSQSDRLPTFDRFGMIPVKVQHGEWYRLATAPFLHVNTEHILFNMVALLIIGPPVEALLGRSRFVTVYVVAGLGGSVCSYLLSKPFIEGVGASGAIFGLFGAYAVLARRHHFDTRTIGLLIGLQLAVSFLDPGIDWRAHIGGLVVGAAVTAGLNAAASRSSWGRLAGELATVAVVLGILAALLALPPGRVNL